MGCLMGRVSVFQDEEFLRLMVVMVSPLTVHLKWLEWLKKKKYQGMLNLGLSIKYIFL